jgi:hypothetical protein
LHADIVENSNYQDEIDPGILACENHLHSLDFETDMFESVLIGLPLFGDLVNLKGLKTIRIALWDELKEDLPSDGVEQWAELNAILAQTRNVNIKIYACFDLETNRMDQREVEVVKKWLPSVSGSGRLQVYSNAGCLFDF